MRHSFNNQLFYEFKSAAFGYPRFIYSGSDLKKIPVFVYHTIDPDLFDSHLKYLKENNYETLSIKDFLNLSGKSFTNNNKVLITIDDARSSVWRYAYPLLKKYGMKASVFVIAGLTVDSPSRRLNLEEAWKGRTSLDRIYEIDPQDNTLCSWEELSDMYHSGLIDIESHTLFHREAFINHKIEDYISHSTSISAYKNPTSAYLSTEDIGKELNIRNYAGLPLFGSSSFMIPGPRINVTRAFIDKCRELFDRHVNNKSNNWRHILASLVRESISRKELFIQNESSKDVWEDLFLAREIIQSKIDIQAGNHLCLPWTIGNSQTVKISKAIGIKSCFWGTLPNKNSEFDPYFVSRIKNDFIFRLPGKDRKSLIDIYKLKLQRRLEGNKIF